MDTIEYLSKELLVYKFNRQSNCFIYNLKTSSSFNQFKELLKITNYLSYNNYKFIVDKDSNVKLLNDQVKY